MEGLYVWAYDGRVETETTPYVGEIVLGHQFHAQILFFDRLHPAVGKSSETQFAGQESMTLESEDSQWRFYYDFSGRPLGMEKSRQDEASIIFTFDDWRTVSGVSLPYEVQIDDGERQFRYRFSSITMNKGSLADFRAPENILTDEQQLLRLHRIAMDDHFFSRTDEMKTIRGDSVTIVNDGDIHRMTGKEFDATMGRIMESRDYLVYDDLVRPIVNISEDGTLGTVIAQISASGVRFDDNGLPDSPLEFVSAWIELYEKVQGQWRLTGNVSNFRPRPLPR